MKCQVFYTVDNPTKNWKGGKGYISTEMARKGLPGPGEDTLVLVSISLSYVHLQSKFEISFSLFVEIRISTSQLASCWAVVLVVLQ